MPYIKERCVAGNVVEVRKYYAPKYEKKNEKRKRRAHPTEEAVKKANLRKAERDLRRLMNNNFSKKSWSITLTFKEPPTLEEIQKEVAKYTRRLRNIAKRKNEQVKYIYVYGIGERRRHAHMIIDGLTAEEITGAWTQGHVQFTKIYSENLRKLAAYFVKNAEDSRLQMIKEGIKPGRRWNGSRNLKKPVTSKKIIPAKTFKTDITVPKGYIMDEDAVFEGVSVYTGLPFFEYALIKKEGARCG